MLLSLALIRQIMAELRHNQIRLYPFDSEEDDDLEMDVNSRIRVRLLVPKGVTDQKGHAAFRHRWL